MCQNDTGLPDQNGEIMPNLLQNNAKKDQALLN